MSAPDLEVVAMGLTSNDEWATLASSVNGRKKLRAAVLAALVAAREGGARFAQAEADALRQDFDRKLTAADDRARAARDALRSIEFECSHGANADTYRIQATAREAAMSCAGSGERWGVWCVEDKAWCMTGTREEAETALPDWASGRAADVDARDFHYEIRKVGP